MVTHPFLEPFAVGSAGALSLELLRLYDLRGVMRTDAFRRLVSSGVYWATVSGMVLASGFLAWAYIESAELRNTKPMHLIIAGIAARTLVRDIASAATARRALSMGAVSLRDVFHPS